MIKIDREKFELDGNGILISTEIALLFKSLNKMLDENLMSTKIMEESIVCDDEQFQEVCKLSFRLNEAHKRVIENEKRWGK